MSETILREFPPNPNLLNYHTRRQLTLMMSERYTPQSEFYPESWIQDLSRTEGVTNLHLLRHQIRLRKDGTRKWDEIIRTVENKLRLHWDVRIHMGAVRTDLRRDFHFPSGNLFPERTVFEGVNQSRAHPLAQMLYEIPGITTLICMGEKVTVKRALHYSWKELGPGIQQVLSKYNHGKSI